ncbi:MAG: NUDIX hydrolase [Deltaproteobacteria bacterium]|nr:NUDIX hydrolase [Deltaproteobacteria bacterium]
MQEKAIPRRASTIVLVRPAADGAFEIFMTRRPQEMRFLGGFYVFPGGSVKRTDAAPGMLELCRGLSLEDARGRLGDELGAEDAFGHWVAAVRELYEEVGVLLCVDADGAPVMAEETRERVVAKRASVLNGAVTFPELLASEGLYCDLASPVYFYHRVTPERYAMRFDTRFFLAPLPRGQVPLSVSEEVTESVWITPEEGLRRSERGRMAIIPPTLNTLSTLAELGTWEALCRNFALPAAR